MELPFQYSKSGIYHHSMTYMGKKQGKPHLDPYGAEPQSFFSGPNVYQFVVLVPLPLQFSFPPSSWASITQHLSFEGLLPCLFHPHDLASKPPNLPGLPFLPAVKDKARSFCFLRLLTANDFWENPKATRALVLRNGKKVLALSLPFMLTAVRL